jgi:PAS domain S-box-containing protein
MQNEMSQEEVMYRLLNEVPVIIWVTAPDGYCTYLNQHWFNYTGQTKEQAEGFGWLTATHPDDKEEAGRIFIEANQQQKPFTLIYRLLTKNGTYRWAKDSGSPRFGTDGSFEGFIGTVADIHDEKKAEIAMRESENRFRMLIQEAPVATCLFVGRELKIEVANDKIIAIMGKGHAVLGRPLAQAIPELVGQPFLLELEQVFNTGETYENRNAPAKLMVDGVLTTFYVDYIFKPLKNADGEVYAILDMTIDVTDHVLARKALQESEERLEYLIEERTRELQRSNEDLQQFAHVASHDLKEPVRKIMVFASRLESEMKHHSTEKAKIYFDKIQSASQRIYTMVEGVLAYSGINNAYQLIEQVDLNVVLKNVEADLELNIQETGAKIRYGKLPVISGASVLLHQLFFNLITNSIKFAGKGKNPVIDISSEVYTDNGKEIASIVLKDNGIGFDNQDAERIFQTFTRLNSKDSFEGTGLGLSLCKKIVERHEGTITARSDEHKGAVFIITLPVHQTKAAI